MSSTSDTADQHTSWIGVDFDGTLAAYEGYKGPDVLGEPVPRMLARVCAWVAAGKDVRIFTARANEPASVAAIRAWCLKHVGRELDVTNVKDHHMHQLWDDRAVQVEKNTGRRMDGCP